MFGIKLKCIEEANYKQEDKISFMCKIFLNSEYWLIGEGKNLSKMNTF